MASETKCTFFCWDCNLLQKFANTKCYLFVYGLIGFAHFGVGSYQSAIFSTVERFQIPSKMTGLIISGWDIGTLICAVFIAFSAIKYHKPQSVAFGMYLTSIACIIWYLPHLIFEYGEITTGKENKFANTSSCELGEISNEICSGDDKTKLISFFFVFANICFGVGTCFYWTHGLTYIDDNTGKNKSPLYLALTMLVSMFGSTFGYMIATFTLSINIDPANPQHLQKNDPRWIGAWWLGFLIFSPSILLLAFVMRGFPRYMPKVYKRKIEKGELMEIEQSETPVEAFRRLVHRLARNKIFIFNTLSSTFYVLGMMGLASFGPKYLETQFHKTASDSSFISGSVSLVCTGLGILSSGLIITLFKPKSRNLALWNVIVESFDVIGYTSFAFLGCPSDTLQGYWKNNEWSLTEDCNKYCFCPPSIKYSPVCTQTGDRLFFSPCHAGCSAGSFNETSQMYFNCTCSPDIALVEGYCPISEQCNRDFYIYVIILCTLRFFSSTGRTGNTILQFRSVKEKDKSASLAFTEGFMSLFAFVPSPIIFGFLIDSTCLVWGESCSGKGNCWLYDSRTLRYYLHFFLSGCLLLSTLSDIVVWKYSKNLEVYDDDDQKKSQELEQLN